LLLSFKKEDSSFLKKTRSGHSQIMQKSAITLIRRGFADVAHGQMHYRGAGDGAPLLVLHGSPGSSKQLVKMVGDLSAGRRVIAPDTAGNGDSDRLPLDAPTICDLAAVLPGFLDALGLDHVDVYGSHTGAAIAAELAMLVPGRIGRVVLDGVQVLSQEAREDVMAHYAFPFIADLDGAYLMRAFQFCRDQYIFYPWYKRSRQAQRSGGLPEAKDLHDWLVEVLKAHETYHLNYRAAFQWEPDKRLPLLKKPVLVIANENDPLAEDSVLAAAMLPNGRFVPLPRGDAPDFRARRLGVIESFLAEDTAS
jgi:pimeloyl-ACP methyl ester carboxylesterase